VRLASVHPLVTTRALARPFTYLVPDDTEVGAVVAIRLGRAKQRGLVVSLDDEAPPGVKAIAVERVVESLPPPLVELALCCTLRVASKRARFQQPEVTFGLIPSRGGSVRLPRLVGTGVAAEALLTGRTFDAAEALRSGWINALLPTEGFTGRARNWAAAIGKHPALALAAAKNSIVAGSRLAFGAAVSHERELFTELAISSHVLDAP